MFSCVATSLHIVPFCSVVSQKTRWISVDLPPSTVSTCFRLPVVIHSSLCPLPFHSHSLRSPSCLSFNCLHRLGLFPPLRFLTKTVDALLFFNIQLLFLASLFHFFHLYDLIIIILVWSRQLSFTVSYLHLNLRRREDVDACLT